MREVSQIISLYETGDLTAVQAERELAKLGPRSLADFIMQAKQRGWISNFNLGLDDEGNMI